jgi:hypothetical protein
VAESVVDVLEAVEVEEQECPGLGSVVDAREVGVELFAVEKARERVVAARYARASSVRF